MNRLISLLRLASLMLCAALLTASANAATINVPAQYATIQDAVTAANVGDTVLLADGIYTGVGNYYIDFHGKDLTVKSANGAANCIIDCQQMGRAFYLHSGETTASYLEGLTMTNGLGGAYGGGVYVTSASNLIVVNCTFTKNQATYAGGGAYGITAANCQFNGNKTTDFNNGYGGGGMYGGTATNCTFNGNVTGGHGSGGGMNGIMATNCVFTNNQANSGGGFGGSGSVINCSFANNYASTGGGYSSSYSNPGTATNCSFISNRASIGGGVWGANALNCVFYYNTASSYGGGMSGGSHTGSATNCIFFGNTAYQSGGGVVMAIIFNCAIVNNTATSGYGGGVYSYSGSLVELFNCIVWGNTAGLGNANIGSDGTVLVGYSDVQGGWSGTGNLNSDPMFVNIATGDLHLTNASPCIDTGTPSYPPRFTFPTTDLDGGKRTIGTKPDMGAYEYGNIGIYGTLAFDGISTMAPAQNVTFQFRPVGGGAAINTKYFTTSDGAFYLYGVPDGKYNLWVKSPTYLSALVPVTVAGGKANITATLEPGNANNDNSVDSTDFGILIGAFNTVADVPGNGYNATADFNGDGSVDSTDFGLLVGSFNMVGAPYPF